MNTPPVIYIAHPVTGEFIGTGYPDRDPLDAENWLIPAHAYPDAPPATAAGEVSVRADDTWLVLPDHRGTVYRTDTGEAIPHAQVGKLPEGLTSAPRPSPGHAWCNDQWHFDQTLADALRADAEVQAWDAIKAERDRLTQTGGYLAAGNWFHSDLFSRSQQIGLVMMGAGIPAGLKWKTMGGTFVPMTPLLAQAVFAAAAAHDQAIFAAAEVHHAAMLASPDPTIYDITAGWPAVYGE